MTTVTISARFMSGENNFVSAVEALLKGLGLKVNSTRLDGGDTFISAEQSDVERGVNEPVEVDVGGLPGVVSGPELTIALPAADVIASSENLPEIPCEVVSLKNLSSNHAVPFSVDESLACSVLKVNELSSSGAWPDPISFSYCGMFFKLPAAKPGTRTLGGADVCNESPEYTDTSIRSLVEFVGTNSDIQPILFKLVVCAEGESSSVVFGRDVLKLVGAIMVKSVVDPA